MIHTIYCQWRKVNKLSATFLLALLVLVACKKQDNSIGASAVDVASLIAAGAIDTFSLETYVIKDDSIVTKNRGLSVLGEMNDPVFGKTKASFYTQIRLGGTNPDFGPMSGLIMDSVILSLQYSNVTGNVGVQTFEVYEIDETISSDLEVNYYEFSSLNVKSTNLVATGKGLITPKPYESTIIDTVEVTPQLRIPLDTNFAKTIIAASQSGNGYFASNDAFLEYFKGLYITTNNPTQASGEGAVFGFNMTTNASKVTFYYKRLETILGVATWVDNEYDLLIDGAAQTFNRVVNDYTGTKIEQALNNKSAGQTEFYCQAFGLRSVVKIPGLSNLPKNTIVNKAILTLPIQYQTGSVYSPGTSVNFFEKLNENSNEGVDITSASVSDFTKSVTQDIGAYVQLIVSGGSTNTPIYISPGRSTTSGDRIIFNGPNTTNKAKPKLYIIYSEY